MTRKIERPMLKSGHCAYPSVPPHHEKCKLDGCDCRCHERTGR